MLCWPRFHGVPWPEVLSPVSAHSGHGSQNSLFGVITESSVYNIRNVFFTMPKMLELRLFYIIQGI